MNDEPSTLLIIDDTILPLFSAEEDSEFEKVELLLNYIAFSKNQCHVKTSQKIWADFKECVPEETETYQYISALITESKIKCYDGQTHKETINDMIAAYSKQYSQILLITNRAYGGNAFSDGDVVLFTIESFNDFIISSRQFREYMDEISKKTLTGS